jgi:hypothetical protein
MPEQVAQRLYDDENSGFTKPEASGGQALEEMFGELSRMADQLTARQATVDAEESDLEEVFGVLEELAEDLSGAQDMVDANGQEHDDLGRFGEGVGEKKFGGRSEKIKLTDFVSSAVKNTSEQKTLLLTEGVSGKTRNRIKDKTGIDIGDARVQLRSDNVRHSNKEHPDLTSSDWKKLAYMIENFDDVKAMREKGSNSEDRLGFTMVDKKTGYGYVADVRISRNKGKRLSVVTFFKDHPKSVANWFENG